MSHPKIRPCLCCGLTMSVQDHVIRERVMRRAGITSAGNLARAEVTDSCVMLWLVIDGRDAWRGEAVAALKKASQS